MKIDDTVWGALLVALGAALLAHVWSFPAIPGQQVGPNAMPGAIAVGLAVCGAVLMVRGLAARAGAAGSRPRWIARPDWFGARPQVAGLAVLVGVNLFYLLAVQRLGFVLTGIVYLGALLLVLGVRPVRALAIAVAATLVIHFAFYKLLRVPLPWGVLQPLAW